MSNETEKPRRLNFPLPMPSTSLKRFIERAIQDEDFFAFALENPLGAMRETGINLEVASFIPADFASFFGALSGLKETIRRKNVRELTFEGIFGQAAEIRGATLRAEIQQGFFKQWDQQAHQQREKCFSAEQSFEVDRERLATAAKELCQSEEVRVQATIEAVGETSRSAETFRQQNTDWDRADSVQNRRAETSNRRNFEKDGQRSLQDLMSGPLIHPEDLAALTARVDAFVKVQQTVD